ncbi:MAG TPA: nuclear transport factor 2 family protein [Acidimicrobiia bacterium]|nr:nuclear transport factor 2 family protein [Acidimicrobiia bacterium]
MPTPKELSDRFVRAYNERDRVAIRNLLPVLEYIRPGGGKLTTADEVMAQYERDWAVLSSSSVEVRELLESDDGIIAEITIRATMSGRPLAVEGVVAQRWRGGRLIRYRLYSDPIPADLAVVQPPAGAGRI